MKPSMYKHQIDAHIRRYRNELSTYRQYGREEFIKTAEDRLQSWVKLRENADVAQIGANW